MSEQIMITKEYRGYDKTFRPGEVYQADWVEPAAGSQGFMGWIVTYRGAWSRIHQTSLDAEYAMPFDPSDLDCLEAVQSLQNRLDLETA